MEKHVQMEAVRQMLESARLPSTQIDELLNQAIDADYWRRLCPTLSVGADHQSNVAEECPLDSGEVARLGEKLGTEGYFQTRKIFSPALIHQMRACVEQLRAQNWPLVFSFVFDEFWTILRTTSVEQVVSGFLGAGCKQNSAVWTYWVSTQKGSAGWTPHTDGSEEHRVSVWLPLTDATLDNGCMYVIPRNLVPKSLPADYTKWANVSKAELSHLLQCSRALPAEAGCLLGWDNSLIHWGSVSSGAPVPRISIAAEFLGTQAKVTSYDRPLLDTTSLPTFEQRLYIIGKNLADYKRFEPLMNRFAEVAQQLMARSKQ
jgi:Phytanoyl-CoA dioxygenase (PhyH)